jgi:anti-anti-sigma factor
MPGRDRTSGLVDQSAREGRNEMFASTFGSEHREGAIRVTRETDGIIAVCFEGDFDMANAPALGDQIDLALESGKDVILDLSEATFIDSSVIDVLVRGSKAASGRKQTVVLQLGTAAIVERVLELARMDQVLPRAHDRQEAVGIIQQQAETV